MGSTYTVCTFSRSAAVNAAAQLARRSNSSLIDFIACSIMTLPAGKKSAGQMHV
jgi:hypothetical protein